MHMRKLFSALLALSGGAAIMLQVGPHDAASNFCNWLSFWHQCRQSLPSSFDKWAWLFPAGLFAIALLIVAWMPLAHLLRTWKIKSDSKLENILRVDMPGQVIQLRQGNFEKLPAAVQGWQFICQNVTFTNRSDKRKLSLDISLRVAMKNCFPKREMILSDSGDMIFGVRPNNLPRPLALETQETKRGTFYFWTGPMHDEKMRESLSDLVIRENMLMVASLDIRNLITDESISIRIPTRR
jgi:hypothetical protein